MPKVCVLFRTLKEHHPEFKLVLVLSDKLEDHHDFSNELVDEVLQASELGIPEWQGWSFCHDIVELSTGIKPFALLNLLSRQDCSKVIYLDPDIALFSRFDDILERLEHATLVLTPHQTTPEPNLLYEFRNELLSLNYGIYNLGFFGVSQTEEGKRFAEWWAQRVYQYCRVDTPNGLFTDQKWIDLAPVLFDDVEIIKSSRHNVAPWNLSTRKLTGNFAEGFQVNGEPLGFYHFSNFDGEVHKKSIVDHLYGDGCALKIIEWYEKEIAILPDDPMAGSPWAFGVFSNGEPISRAQRTVYRERVDLQAQFPDPFDCSLPDSYYLWWHHNAFNEYPNLFDETLQKAELEKMNGAQTPGFLGAGSEINWKAAGSHISKSLLNKASREKVAGRFWEVIRAEGISGIVSRIRSRSLTTRKMK